MYRFTEIPTAWFPAILFLIIIFVIQLSSISLFLTLFKNINYIPLSSSSSLHESNYSICTQMHGLSKCEESYSLVEYDV